MNKQLVVIGGGPAGLGAAIEASKNGIKDILLIERADTLGGILMQCIHNGFGLKNFKKELTGPEYATRFIRELKELGIEYMLDTIVLDVTKDKEITVASPKGYEKIKAEAVILAMGCRERTRGALRIPGERPAGVMTAGLAQRLINIDGYMPGKKVLILGSGDIGLIMARRLTLEGAEVKAVVEIAPTPSGLERNIVQCLNDFNIPLYLSHTVSDVIGKERVEKIIVSKVDSKWNAIPGTEMEFDCDTLLLSVGLIPENELSLMAGIKLNNITNGPEVNEYMETSVDGIFACGNVCQVHDLADNVTLESQVAGRGAAKYIQNKSLSKNEIKVTNGNNIRYVVPQYLTKDCNNEKFAFSFRVVKEQRNANIIVKADGKEIKRVKREKLIAGEMERMPFALDLLNQLDCKEVTLEVCENEQ